MRLVNLVESCYGQEDLAFLYLTRMLRQRDTQYFYFELQASLDLFFTARKNDLFALRLSRKDGKVKAYPLGNVKYIKSSKNIARFRLSDGLKDNLLSSFEDALTYNLESNEYEDLTEFYATKEMSLSLAAEHPDFVKIMKLYDFVPVEIVTNNDVIRIKPISIELRVSSIYIEPSLLEQMRDSVMSYRELIKELGTRVASMSVSSILPEIEINKASWRKTKISYLDRAEKLFNLNAHSSAWCNVLIVSVMRAMCDFRMQIQSISYRDDRGEEEILCIVNFLFSQAIESLVKEQHSSIAEFDIYRMGHLLQDFPRLLDLLFSKKVTGKNMKSKLLSIDDLNGYTNFLIGLVAKENKLLNRQALFPQHYVFHEFIRTIDLIESKYKSEELSAKKSVFVKHMREHVSRDNAYVLQKLAHYIFSI